MNRLMDRLRNVSRLGLALTAIATSVGAPAARASTPVSEGPITVYPLPAGSRPHVLTVGADGAVWFSMAGGPCLQAAGNKIGRIASDGRITEYLLPTPDSYPGAIAVGPDGALWFGQRSTNTIGRMTLDGQVAEYPVPTAVTVTMRDGFAPDVECSRQSSYPAEGGIVAGADDALWFTEGQGNQIGRISLDGQVTEYPLPTAGSNPIGIELGPDGALWFIERLGNKVGRITTGGDITEYAIPTPDSFANVIVAGPDGNLWFTELRGDNIARITLSGDITEYPTPGLGPVGLAFAPDGALWSAGFTGRKVARMTTDGVITDEYAVPIPEGTPGLCCGVTVTSDGSVWFVATEASLIGRVQVQRPSPPPDPTELEAGMKVDVGGYALFVRCTGHGSPPAVFDAGANAGSSAWSKVEPKVAAFTRTCVYDRANREKSDKGPIPNTSQQIVHDLHTLLGKSQVAGPFVLVGHSFGGMNVGLYARLYPTEAAGLVMLDAAHEAIYVGLGTRNGVDYSESGRQVQAAPPMPAIPLIVIEHGLPSSVMGVNEAQWHAWQQDLASRSPQGKLIVAEQSRHEIESDQPDLVVAAVQEILEQVRR